MRVAIDNRLAAYRIGGIPQYTQQLAAQLAIAAPDDHFVLIDHRKAAQPPGVSGVNVAHRRVWTPPHHRWEQWALPIELANLPVDLLHFPDFIPLFHVRWPSVITIHDLAFLRYPEILDDAARRFYGQIQRAVGRAAAIIAVSHSTRRDIVELLGVDPQRIDVVHEAAAPIFQPIDGPHERTIGEYTLRRDQFALFVGTIEPRKNLATLIQALHVLHQRGIDTPLVIAGARGWLDDEIFKLVRDLNLADSVRFVGGIDQPTLVWLYNACRVYLHPELYSGFGLPILEAMQCGAPVLAADTSSLPEVVGAAGLLLPPTDIAAWADAWQQVWSDSTLRDRLRAAGTAHAATFSWRRAAHETLAIYRRVIA